MLANVTGDIWNGSKKAMGTQQKKHRRFTGISAAAERLGVHRGHLWAVLSGRRQSRSLMRRYHEECRRVTRQTNEG